MFKGTSILVLAVVARFHRAGPGQRCLLRHSPFVISNWSKAACRSDPTTTNWRYYQRLQAMEPYAVVEAAAKPTSRAPAPTAITGLLLRKALGTQGKLENHILLRAPEGKEIKGRLVLAKADASGMDCCGLSFPPRPPSPRPRSRFTVPSWPITITCWPATSPAGPGSGIRPAWPGSN